MNSMNLLLKRQPVRRGAVGRDMVKSVALAALLSVAPVAVYGQSAAAPPEHIVSTGDFNVNGNIAAGSLIGAKVRNANRETIGKIDEVFLDKDALMALPDYDRTDRHKAGLPDSVAEAPARPNPRQSR
jgi:hypothetical protein